MRFWQVRPILFLCAILVLIPFGGASAGDSPEVPVVDAGLGSCRADFIVKDSAGKPIFDANAQSPEEATGIFHQERHRIDDRHRRS